MHQHELIYDLVKEIKDMQQLTLNEITEIKVEQAKQSVQISRNSEDLAHHILRTDLLEEELRKSKESYIECRAKCKVIDGESKGVSVKNISVGIGLLATLIGIIVAIKNLL